MAGVCVGIMSAISAIAVYISLFIVVYFVKVISSISTHPLSAPP